MYVLFIIFRFFVGGSCEVGSNWVSDCSWKPSKLLLPPHEGASIVNGDPLISTSLASNGTGTCNGAGEKFPPNVVDEICTSSCIAAVDNSPPRVIINTLCLKERRFPEPNACTMVEQLTPALMRTVGAGDEALDTCAMASLIMTIAGAGFTNWLMPKIGGRQRLLRRHQESVEGMHDDNTQC